MKKIDTEIIETMGLIAGTDCRLKRAKLQRKLEKLYKNRNSYLGYLAKEVRKAQVSD